ncbi:unnamed protein product [Alopecurus aequalis]
MQFTTIPSQANSAHALLGKSHVPDLEWKIHDFPSLLDTKASSVLSDPFDCSGYKWYLQVSPMHKENGGGTPYVALSLMLSPYTLEQGHTLHAVFEFSIYNHSNRMYCGCKANYNFELKNYYSKKECLIPLQELQKSSAFLVDDSCVFGLKILKIDVCSPEKKAVVVQQKATTVHNLFVQKKGFVKGTYTWTVNNFLELDLKNYAHSPTFEVGEHKWYISMYPRGNKCSTDCLSLFLRLDASNELPLVSRNVVQMTLSIQDQDNGKHCSVTSGLTAFRSGWGWANFIPLKKFKDPSGGYPVESHCVVKADLTIFGSSNDG